MRGTKRGDRMAEMKRMKVRARRIMSRWTVGAPDSLDARRIGIGESTHCCACSCWLCSGDEPRVPSPRERAFHDPKVPSLGDFF